MSKKLTMIKVLTCQQGSAQWLLARLGKPTGSWLSNIVTPTGKAVKGEKRTTYLYQLLGERITGQTTETYVSEPMKRGTFLEPEARSWYELTAGVSVEQVGFVIGDGGKWGVSPDGLVGKHGGLEIKCSTLPIHLKNVLAGGVPATWAVQVQACMWVCERAWWDVVLYTDAINVPSVVVRAEQDAVVIDTLKAEVPAFCEELDALEADIRQRFAIPERRTRAIEDASSDSIPF